MRRNFLLFVAANYYPIGGMSDCQGQFNTLQEAIDYVIRTQPKGWLDDTHVLEIGDKQGATQLIVHHIKPDTGTVEVSVGLPAIPKVLPSDEVSHATNS